MRTHKFPTTNPEESMYEFSGEFRKVHYGEYYWNQFRNEISQWNLNDDSRASYFIIRHYLDFLSLEYTLKVLDVYTRESVLNIPPKFRVIGFRFPKIGEYAFIPCSHEDDYFIGLVDVDVLMSLDTPVLILKER